MNANEILYKAVFDETTLRLLNAIEVKQAIDLWLINELCTKSIDCTAKKLNVHSTDLLSNINYAQLVNDLQEKTTSLGATMFVTPSEFIGGTINTIHILHYAQLVYMTVDGVQYRICNQSRVNNGYITSERNTNDLTQHTISYAELFRKEHGECVQDVLTVQCDGSFVTVYFPVIKREDYDNNRVRLIRVGENK